MAVNAHLKGLLLGGDDDDDDDGILTETASFKSETSVFVRFY